MHSGPVTAGLAPENRDSGVMPAEHLLTGHVRDEVVLEKAGGEGHGMRLCELLNTRVGASQSTDRFDQSPWPDPLDFRSEPQRAAEVDRQHLERVERDSDPE